MCINGYYFGNLQTYNLEYIYNLNFILGFLIFLLGALINIVSDNILLKLKKEDGEYKIPKGYLYKYISIFIIIHYSI